MSISPTHDLIYFFDISRDGRAALFALRRGPTMSVGRGEASGLPVRLTSDSNYDDGNPLWSPDGTSIAFSRRRVGSSDPTCSLWLMSADGANPQQLVERIIENPQLSRDGRHLAYSRGESSGDLWLMEFEQVTSAAIRDSFRRVAVRFSCYDHTF